MRLKFRDRFRQRKDVPDLQRRPLEHLLWMEIGEGAQWQAYFEWAERGL